MAKKIVVIIIALVLIAALLIGSAAIVSVIWEDSMLASNKIVNQFALTDEAIKNPVMGFAAAATSRSNVSDNSLVYVDITFRELEPEEGVFDFAKIEEDNHLDLWRSEGKHVVLRFICDYPGEEDHLDIPDWLYEKTNGDGTHYDISYGKGYSPNYNNEIFIEYHAKAIKALGEYFGNDTFVSYIELGSLGHWGEWHVKYSSGIERIPLEDVRLQYILPYIEAFPNAQLLMRRPFDAADEYGFGIYNDMIGNEESTNAWIDWIQNGGDYDQTEEKNALVIMDDCWKTAPIGGEFTSSLSMDWMLKDNIDETIQMIADTHTTFIGPKFPKETNATDDSSLREGVEQIIVNMGYRYAVIKAEISESRFSSKTKVVLTWTNDGVAPIYMNWPVYLYVLNENNIEIDKFQVDIKLSKLLPDMITKTTNTIDLAAYEDESIKLCVGIVDPMTGAPAVILTCDAQRIDNMSIIYNQ